AWKIAYADFVTAMMAFFLLMWLLGSTTQGDRQGIADYFQSPLKISLAGGDGSGDSSHVIRGGGADLTRSSGQVRRGDVEARRQTITLMALRSEQRRAEKAQLGELLERVRQTLAADPALAAFQSQIRLELTPEGLRIQIVDALERPLFDSGRAFVPAHLRDLLRAIGAVLAEVPNRITLEGHTDAAPYGGQQRGYSNWELSADRANASRRELVAGGLPSGRLLRVQGLADSRPLDRQDPRAAANRRISIVVMNRDAEERFFEAAPTDTDADAAGGEAAARHSLPPPLAALPSIRPELGPPARRSSPPAARR
ncbi:MAG: flagellar motor protein MotB, partial [Rubrivivax sp.]